MADPSFSDDFFMDPNFSVKQEQISMDTSSSMTASVPIPPRKILDISELRGFGFDFDTSSSPSASNECVTAPVSSIYHALTVPSQWSTRLDVDSASSKVDCLKMDDDDIFQVDKADLIQGPTLAELNANDESLLDDLNFDDLLLPEESSYYLNVTTIVPQSKDTISIAAPSVQITNTNTNMTNNNASQLTGSGIAASSFPPAGFGFYKDSFLSSSVPSSPMDIFSKTSGNGGGAQALSPASQHSSSSSLLLQSAASSITPPPLEVGIPQQRHSTLHELLLKKEASSVSPDPQLMGHLSPVDVAAGSPGPSAGPSGCSRFLRAGSSSQGFGSRLSSSAPTHLGLDQIWQRREPRQHLLSTGSLAEAGSTSSISTGGVLSPESHEFSHDEGFDSEDDSDHYEDYSSDGDSDCDAEMSAAKAATRRERYFWQYNVQAKGPKGQRLVLKTTLEDPHVLNEVTDPVFSPGCSVQGIKHSGKARKGDGNDLTPNPRKLCSIGRELDKLSQIINDMTPVSELPFNVRPKTRKEKNKLASRACRLKKKAQHEANKLKLYGLESEHRRLNQGISQIKQVLAAKCTTDDPEKQEELTKHIDRIAKQATKIRIAGHTTEFVNKVLDKVKSGVPSGGLEEL